MIKHKLQKKWTVDMSLSFGPIQQLLFLRKLCLLYKKKKKSDKKVKGFSLIIGEILLTWYHILKTVQGLEQWCWG